MRLLLCLALSFACLGAWAQATAPLQGDEAAPGRRNQRIERIVHEDRGNRIEEVRVGGQTQSITVQPRGDMPPYEIDPGHLSRSRPADNRNGLSSTGGQRSWNVLRF